MSHLITYHITGYPNERIFGISCFCVLTLHRVVALCLRTPISAGRFFGTSRIFSNPAANWQAVAAGDYGHNIGNALFSSSRADSFYRIAIFISERTRAQLWHYFIASLFHTTLALPKLRALRVRTKNTFLDRSNLLHWFVVPRGVVILSLIHISEPTRH